MLKERWQAGAHDEETAFRLLFLLWYNIVEPISLTGLPRGSEGWFARIFRRRGRRACESPHPVCRRDHDGDVPLGGWS